MQREINFRAWDVINKQMYPIAFPSWNGVVTGKIDFVSHEVVEIEQDGDDNPILMQFTGILDRNGKKIYEGDVVVWTVNGHTATAPVCYMSEQACFWMGERIHDGGLVLNDWMRGEYEVIGNIYENSELLK